MVQSIVLTGPTAVGKSSLSIEWAEELGLEIINADSVCFYRGFDIGSAKPDSSELARIPHHLIDVANPLENYHAGRFLSDCRKKIDEIHSRGKRALITGGSGFYLKALRFGLWEAPEGSAEFRAAQEHRSLEDLFSELKQRDPAHALKTGPADRYRIIRALEILELSGKRPSELESAMPKDPDPAFPLFVIDRDPKELETRMKIRISRMLESGWMEETRSLRERFPDSRVLRSVGYAQILDHFDGTPPSGRRIAPGIEGLVSEILLAHRQLAKTQRTWFKNQKPEQEFVLERDLQVLKERLMRIYQ
jgi:tRNA dimethylallyltransferase